MILRRMIDHVRTQNWLAVFLDFVIVVLGVFIGIQLGNWNAARGDRAIETRALTLLLEEAENNVAYSRLIIYRAGKLQADRIATNMLLNGGEADPEAALRGLSVMTAYRDMTPIHAAYDELTSSGGIVKIRSDAIRGDLSLYNGVVIFHDRARQEYMDRAPDIMSLASPYMTLTYNPAEATGYGADVDWQAAAGDRALRNAVARVMGEQIVFSERREIVRDHVERLCQSIAAELGVPCDPPDWVANEIAGEAFE